MTVRGTSYSFIGKDGKSRVMTPDAGWNYNPGAAQTLFDPPPPGVGAAGVSPGAMAGAESKRYLIKKLNEASPANARRAVREMVESPLFEEAFAARTLRHWPLAVLPAYVRQGLERESIPTGAQVVTYRVEDKKLGRDKHPLISVARLRALQKALDRGLVAVEKPGRRRQHGRDTLLAMYYEDGTWWRHAINI